MTTPSPEDEPIAEQRQNPRVDLFRDITCEGGGVELRARVAELSVGGMFIDTTRTPLPVGSRVVVRCSLLPDEEPLALDAEVSYVQEGIGTGVRFVGLAGDDWDRIAAFVEESLRRRGAGAPPLRKSARVTVQVPIRVRGAGADGGAFDETTRLVTLSKHGACLVSAHAVEVGAKLRLETKRGIEFLSNVVWVGSEATRSAGQVGVQCRGLAQSLGFQFP